jgi:hypothetical protein
MAQADTSTRISQVGTVMIPVSDQDRAIAFYTEKLGFEVRSDTPFGNGDRWVEVAPAGAATTVAFSTSDIDSDHAQLRERGVDCDDVMRMGDPVPPMFFFRDQDSNNLLLVQAG